MVCVYCKGKTQVINSRHQKRHNQVWRRRECVVCGKVFTTHETADMAATFVVRTASGGQQLHTHKLMMSIYEACKHRPHALEDAQHLTDTVIASLVTNAENGTIERDMIVITTLEILNRFDQTAAAVYKAFHPVNA